MGFDSVTFVAQIVNLFVLVWLLKRFLYKPILTAVEARQKEIWAHVQKARDAEKEADALREELAAQKKDFLKEKERLLAALQEEMDGIRQRKMTEIQLRGRAESHRIQEELNRRLEDAQSNTTQFFIDFFPGALLKAFADISGKSAFEESLHRFLKKLERLPQREKHQLSAPEWLLEVSHPLTNEMRELLKSKIFDVISPKAKLTIRINPRLVLGARLSNSSAALEWNLEKYMIRFNEELRKNTAQLVEKGSV